MKFNVQNLVWGILFVALTLMFVAFTLSVAYKQPFFAIVSFGAACITGVLGGTYLRNTFK